MSTDDDSTPFPQSIRHKQVLDTAEDHPDASIDEIAAMVPSATPDLVERVFDEYGDPAADEDATEESSPEDPSMESDDRDDPDTAEATTDAVTRNEEAVSDEAPTPDGGAASDGEPTSDAEGAPEETSPSGPDESTEPTTEGTEDSHAGEDAAESASDDLPTAETLSEKQREVLAVVAERPAATQQEIGDRLDVSSATVSNRVNSIEGFDWSARETLVEQVFDEPPTAAVTTDGGPAVESTSTDTEQPESTDIGQSESTTADDEQADTDGSDPTAEIEDELARINERLAALEAADEQESSSESAGTDSAFADPALVHKVAHACLDSDAISEAEELRIFEELLE
ncbi:winged helix-turn-helix transcriptional regulator [Natronoarchaeum sp. GCM10025703]|uniref:winged helix-turn-helix transcriptional regulator n=1 Tax=unclassified Natronoarchaeum TaxID=2620183 RepID=UPI0036088EB9